MLLRRGGSAVYLQFLFSLTALVSLFLMPVNYSEAAINDQIPFSGTLRDSSDNLLTGTYDMVFRFYDAASGGTLLDTSTHTAANGNAVSVSNGAFSVLLGSGTGNALDGLNFNSASIFVGVTIGSDTEMTPRQQLAAAPYAFNSDTLDGYDYFDFIQNSTAATGSVAALYLTSGTPTNSTNALYQVGGTLYFNGAAVAAGGGSFFTQNGSTTYLTGLDDWLAIGTTSANATLTVHGNVNISSSTAGIQFNGISFITASSGNDSIAFGEGAGESFAYNSLRNVAIGYRAGRFASTTAVDYGVFIGANAAGENRGGTVVAIGASAGYYNRGNTLVAIGASAGWSNTGSNNILIGESAGQLNQGDYNIIFGTGAGNNNTGDYNNFIGGYAGNGSEGSYTIAIGEEAGRYNTGDYNSLVGYAAGYQNFGAYNEFFGYEAGSDNTGNYNQFIGYRAGYNLKSTSSVVIGAEAYRGLGGSNFSAVNNVALGYRAGYRAQTGASNNILIGYQAADSLTTGANNIVIGYDIDLPQTTQSHMLSIGNLIFGTNLTATGTATSSGNVGIGTSSPSHKLTVDGSIFATALYAPSSNLTFAASGTSVTSRTVQAKLRDIVSLLDYGATGNGSTDDRAALVAADSDGQGVIFLPYSDRHYRLSSAYNPTTPIISFGGRFIQDSGTFFARSLTDFGSYPYTYGLRTHLAADYPDTPVENYTEVASSSQLRLQWINQAGYQEEDTNGNLSGSRPVGLIPGGQSRLARTGMNQVYLQGAHSGMGDGYNMFFSMTGSQHSSTSDVVFWSGQNSAGWINGQNNALSDKVNLYGIGDLSISDQGYDDVAMFGQTIFLTHDGGNSGDYNIPRLGQLIESAGSNNIDAASVVRGNFYLGIDLTDATFASSTAIALAQEQRISWDATAVTTSIGKFTTQNLGLTHTYFDGTKLLDVVGNVPIFQRYSDRVLVTTGGDNANVIRAVGATATAFGGLGQIGTTTYVTAGSVGTDNTTLVLRTAAGGVEADRVVVSSAGSVGVGTSTPGSLLDVWGDVRIGTSSTPLVFADVSNQQVAIATSTLTVGAALTLEGALSVLGFGTSTFETNFAIADRSSFDFTLPEDADGVRFFQNSTNFGYSDLTITRKNDPDTLVNLAFTGPASITANAGLDGSGNYTPSLSFNADGSVQLVNVTQGVAADRVFEINLSSGVSIEAGGLGIGTTTSNATLNVWGETIIGTSSVPVWYVNTAGAFAAVATTSRLSASTTLTVDGYVGSSRLAGGVTTLSADAFGNIIRTPSDLALKERVVTIDHALESVLSLRGVRFEWKDKERFGTGDELGFIAQEVDLVLPEVVQKGGDYWALNTQNIVAVVVEAIKEIWGTVTGNQERIAELEQRVADLEAASHNSTANQPSASDRPGTTAPRASQDRPTEPVSTAVEETVSNPSESESEPVPAPPASGVAPAGEDVSAPTPSGADSSPAEMTDVPQVEHPTEPEVVSEQVVSTPENERASKDQAEPAVLPVDPEPVAETELEVVVNEGEL